MLPHPSAATSRASAPAESAYHRSCFYVGGQYVDDGTGTGQHVFLGQMYVEQLTPINHVKQPWPVVFIHGAGQTGTNFLNTPDGRKGWASWLLDQGYTVYLLDHACRGRSAYHPFSGPSMSYTAETAEQRWTGCRHHLLWPEAALHTQWPGSGRIGDPIFDAYYASTVPSLLDFRTEQSLVQAAGASLLDRIGPAVLITHSQGGTHGWLWADIRPDLVKAIVAIEPSGPPFHSTFVKGSPSKLYGITDIPLRYDPPPPPPPADDEATDEAPLKTQLHHPPVINSGNGKPCILQAEPARKLTNLEKIPILVETGEASSHAAYDECTVRFLRQAGVKNVTHLRLADDEGIRGNGHLQFLEKNNLEIIALLERWIATAPDSPK